MQASNNLSGKFGVLWPGLPEKVKLVRKSKKKRAKAKEEEKKTEDEVEVHEAPKSGEF